MKFGPAVLLLFIGVFGVVIEAAAEPEPDVSPAPQLVPEFKNSIIIKTGTFTIRQKNQNLQILGPVTCDPIFCGLLGASPSHTLTQLPVEIGTSSKEVVGIAYERRTNHGFSYGGEILHMSNSLYIPSLSSTAINMKTNFVFAEIKKYFGEPDSVRPYLLGGLGVASADLKSIVNNNASGLAAQILCGFSYQMGRTSLFAEYRYLIAPSISLPSGENTGDIEGSLKLSGYGFNIGLGARF
ncbi:MAG: hypothetical protein WAW02_02415 [Sideroxyarcus sp.]